MDLFQKCQDYTIVKEVMDAGLYPYFHALQSGQDTVVTMEGHRTIMIGSNNYLGLTSDPRVIEAAVEAVKKYGSGCSGSRFLNGTLDIHLELERQLAEFLHKDGCITFSTGFQSNLGIISAIAGRNDIIICDKENHASIYDACRLSFATMVRFKHNDMEDLERLLREAPDSKGRLIVTDGVFSMGGEICNLPKIVELARKYGARIMIDDAHGLGVLGETGRGTAEHFGLMGEVDIIMGTFSKSLASLGGFMVAKADVINYVKHTSRPFIFSASIPPANVAAALCALNILKKEPERVRSVNAVADYMKELMKKNGIPLRETRTPIIPVMTYDDMRTFKICKELLEEGVYVNPTISPAVPQGQSMIRTSYTATHTRELMDEAIEKFVKVFSKY
ncbi:MAG TPA: 8-amino-7-oxononanoate synthase [Ruminiclostridium sp.]|jgi:8-amino-7-oxononanoate synthase|nr:8-amino-7-oxononanoate synthase [Ruminiclostridium sp.]